MIWPGLVKKPEVSDSVDAKVSDGPPAHTLVMRISIKLGVLCAVSAMVPLMVASLITVFQVSGTVHAQVVEQSKANARAAMGFYDKRLDELQAAAAQLGETIATRALVSSDTTDRAGNTAAWARLQDLLPRSQKDYFLDFVIVTDPTGKVIARHNDHPAQGETLIGTDDKNPIVEKVIAAGGGSAAGCVIERGDRYQKLWLDRIAKVKLTDGSTVDEALMMEAAAPIYSAGRFVGIVVIGQMLNTYWKPRPGASPLQTPLVAEVRQALCSSNDQDCGILVSNNRGILASSIPPRSSGRDSGSDPELYRVMHDPSRPEEALSDGDGAYFVAWQPLKSPDGSVIGSIGVARPLTDLSDAGEAIRSTMLLIGSIATVLAGAAGFLFGRILGTRIDELREAASRWTVGELSAAAGDTYDGENGVRGFLKHDEITTLAGQMEQMRLSIKMAIERLRKR